MAITLVGSSGVSGAATNGTSITLTWATAPSAGDVCVILSVDTQTSDGAKTILTGSGAAYTTLLTTSNGNLRSIVAYRVAGTGETTATCSHSGAAADATASAGFVFRGAKTPIDISISSRATGTSSRPDSPSDTVRHTGSAVISAVCTLANSAAAVTAPSGYLNLISTGASDTRSCQLGMSWVTSTNVSVPTAYDPTAYSSFTSAAWMGFTIVLESTDPVTPGVGTPGTLNNIRQMFGKTDVVNY